MNATFSRRHIVRPRSTISLRPAGCEPRVAALRLLALPFLLLLLAFIVAVSVTAAGGQAERASLRLLVAGTSYLWLIGSFFLLPGYLLAYAWYWWRQRVCTTKLTSDLYLMPPIAAAFCWFPAVLMSQAPLDARLQVLPFLFGAALILGFIWVCLVRGVLYFWKEI